ncbi:MAG: hypothetical protein FWH28_03155 [Clostridiales bacterium]|nr:hypothetical protein [Clostridiales bacterium]
MKSTILKKTYVAIYRLLDRVSPIRGDCGALCGQACCDCDDLAADASKASDMGMYLLPGEEKVYTRREDWLTWSVDPVEYYDFPDSWRGMVYFIKCNNAPHCVRKLRPIQCRTFPLAPHITKSGSFHLILNTDALPYVCPLITEQIPLNRSFIRATYTVWKRLIKDPLIYDLVKMDSGRRSPNTIIVR